MQGAPRATLEIAAPQSAEELFRHQAFQAKYEAEASLILAHAEEKAGEAQRALRKAKSRPIGCMAVAGDRLSGKMVFQELADTRLGQASVQPPDEWVRPSAAASAAVAAGDQAQRPAYTFLHKNEAYAHGLRNSIAWDGGKAEDPYLGYLGDPEPVVLTESGPPMFDNEVEECVILGPAVCSPPPPIPGGRSLPCLGSHYIGARRSRSPGPLAVPKRHATALTASHPDSVGWRLSVLSAAQVRRQPAAFRRRDRSGRASAEEGQESCRSDHALVHDRQPGVRRDARAKPLLAGRRQLERPSQGHAGQEDVLCDAP